MSLTDSRGVPVSTTNPASLARLELATRRVAAYTGDSLGPIDQALAEDPDFAMGHAFRAGLAVITCERSALPMLSEAVAALERLAPGMNDRERAHAGAARAWLEGDFARSIQRYGDIAIDYPRDLFALQVAHVGDFLLGDSLMLRDRIARALPAWEPDVPDMGKVLGLYAFGLEETAHYRRAEDAGMRALALDPCDPWAVHAVAHVMEMQGRVPEGVSWLTSTSAHWAGSDDAECLFAYHNWWHLALYHLDLDDRAAALSLYDRRVHPRSSAVAMENVDAASLLWRLALRGVDAGARWAALADDWAAAAEDGFYAFNDFHAILAYLGADRSAALERTLTTMAARAAGHDTNAAMTREVGLPLARGFVAFHRGDFAAACDHLLPVRSIAHRFGGSHAQRDIVHQTLIEAALRGGRSALARALANERTELRPTNPFERRFAERARAVA